MPSPVPSLPQPNLLARQIVGAPVSGAAHVGRWLADLAYLLGYAQVQPIADVLLPIGGNGTDIVRLSYNPSVGPQALMVLVEHHRANAAGALGTTTVAASGALASATWLQANNLDGTAAVPQPNAVLQNYPIQQGVMNIASITRGTADALSVTHVDSGVNSRGIYRLKILEVPRAAFDVVGAPTTEPAVDQSWGLGGNPIVDGSNLVARGTYRIWDALDSARYKQRHHWQIAALETTNTSKCFSTTSAAFANPSWAGLTTTAPAWRMRARALYGTSVANRGALRVRYACTNSAATAALRFTVTPVGGAATNYDVTCNAGGSTAFQWGTLANVDLPTSGTDQEVDIAIQARVSAGTLYFCNVAWIESES